MGAYWAGGRWGQRQPLNVGAVPRGPGGVGGSASGGEAGRDARTVKNATEVAARDSALTDDESINVRVYR